MDESENIIKEYFDSLPESFKKAVSNFDWQKKVTELGQKYSLTQTQVSDLSYEVLFVLVGVENDNNLTNNIQQKLGVTAILAGEITEELEEKVFSVIVDMADKDDNKKIETVSRSPIPKVIVPQKSTDLPQDNKPKYGATRLEDLSDVAPDNLPVSDEDEKILHPEISIPRYIPTKIEEVRAEADKKYEDLKQYTATEMQAVGMSTDEPVSRIKYKPAGTLSASTTPQVEPQPVIQPAQEYVQKPQSVPRLDFNNGATQKSPIPTPSIESRWDDAFKEAAKVDSQNFVPTQNITSSPVSPPPKPTQPSSSSPIIKSYTADPYREPIE